MTLLREGTKRPQPRACTSNLACVKNPVLHQDVGIAALNTQAYVPVLGCKCITARSIDPWTPMPECAAHAYRERWKQSVPLDLA